jgi:hypothetical protein
LALAAEGGDCSINGGCSSAVSFSSRDLGLVVDPLGAGTG